MPLTDTAIKNAKPGRRPVKAAAPGAPAFVETDKPYKLPDERGLYLEVTPQGGKYWRFKYRIGGKEKRISLGVYPDVPLALARKRRDAARELVAQDIDPSEHRKATNAAKLSSAANSFEVVAREWYGKQKATWNAAHGTRILRRLERDIFPHVGSRPIADIEAPELLALLNKIEARGAIETAHRALQNCGQVFDYAIASGRCKADPTRALRGALKPVKPRHLAAVTEADAVGPLLLSLHGYQGGVVVRAALQLAPLVFVRPGELRSAKWADIDLDAAEWRYRVSKTDTDHIVPLATQAVAILKDLKGYTGSGPYVFPSPRTRERPMSENAVLAALRSLGISGDTMTGHGFRAMARTILDEVLGERPDLIEHQLAHAVRDPLGRAYNRTQHLPERRRMMQRWADWLDAQRTAAAEKAKTAA